MSIDDAIIHIVDDEVDVRSSMALVLESAGFRTRSYSSGPELLNSLDRNSPGCVITDMRMPEMNGIGLLTKIQESGARLPVVIVSAHSDIALAVHAMKKGAVDFIEKPFQPDRLIGAVRAAVRRLAQNADETSGTNLSELSAREVQVLDRVLAGKPSKLIARELAISERTVESHRASILRKSGARNLAELVRMAASEK